MRFVFATRILVSRIGEKRRCFADLNQFEGLWLLTRSTKYNKDLNHHTTPHHTTPHHTTPHHAMCDFLEYFWAAVMHAVGSTKRKYTHQHQKNIMQFAQMELWRRSKRYIKNSLFILLIRNRFICLWCWIFKLIFPLTNM